MGYDMYLIGTERPAMPEDKRYHRKNIWGMRTARDLMETFEMGFWPDKDIPWPKESKLSEEESEKLHDMIDERIAGEIGEDASDKLIAIADRRIKHLARGEPQRGIALHKFASNDGWWVTADECKHAVEAYERVPDDVKKSTWKVVAKSGGGWDASKPDEVREWFEEFVSFLRRGAEGKGFRVF